MATKDTLEGQESDLFSEFQIGDQVKHPKWGTGAILFRSGTGENTKVIVVFPEEGQKKLALKYAKLTRIQSAKQAMAAAIIEEKENEEEDPFEKEIEGLDDDADEVVSPAAMEKDNPFGDDEQNLPTLPRESDEEGE